jgi:hypothetical protein
VIPHAVLIFRKDKVIFFNDASVRLFDKGCHEEEGKELLEAITIERENNSSEISENNVHLLEAYEKKTENLLSLLKDFEASKGMRNNKFCSFGANYTKKTKNLFDSVNETAKKTVPIDIQIGDLLNRKI